MHKSLRSALPALRPVSPANVEVPRDSISKAVVAGNPRFSTDFEVNRSLFVQELKPKIFPPSKPKNAPRVVPQLPEKIDTKIDKQSDKSLEKTKEKSVKIAKQLTPENLPPQELTTDSSSSESIDPNLKQIQDLFERIPTGKEPVPLDEVYRLSPVLDRVLCVVTEMRPEFISENLSHPIVVELQHRLFNLIDIDDFLTRTIICRILLSFATDASSPLLLPISRIFYKLSCDQANDQFFEEEQLIPVLISLIKIAQPEARVFAAGALRNIAACELIRASIVKSEFFELSKEIFANEKTDNPLRSQIIGAIKLMCKNEDFKKQLAESKFLSVAIKDTSLLVETMRVVCLVQEISSDEKLTIIKCLAVSDLKDAQSKRVVTRSLSVLSVDMENTAECTLLVIKLLNLTKEEPELLNFLLAVAQRCAETEKNVDLLENQADIFIEILKSQDYDTSICLAAYNVVKEFKGEQFAKILSEYSLLTEINQSK
ncbi:hypothetical protein TRFO_11178 [Tritrichomonas foetus]|uniref:Armadillo/beta-catenin-like repeat family protein n=1 Tax=Tritrichomonas foetus TaxID=1144522 RepID=A0A1J4J9J3_9EUKA|nr:hypothetical protein TRFO_11178 [Tritrichomonas foetus]|eukprot:OHS94323.1 hypothetical protein TRFO_11178 [Tritrichomonas foetus]